MNNRAFMKKLLIAVFATLLFVCALPVFGETDSCGEHSFSYSTDYSVEITAEGVDYRCVDCQKVVKSVKIDEGGAVEHKGTVTLNAKSMDLISGEDFYDEVLRPTEGGSIWLTFKVKPTDLSGFSTSSNGSTLLKFQVGNTHRIMLRAFRVDDKSVKITCQDSAGKTVELAGSPKLVAGNSYSFVIEYNPDTKNYYIYMDGKYLGGSGYQIAYNATDTYKLYFGGSGNWELSDFRVFNPTYVHGDHAFDYNEYIGATLTDSGVEFRCVEDGELIRTVDIGRGSPIVIDKVTGNSVNLISDSEEFYSKVVAPPDGGSFFMTFDLTPTDLSGFNTDTGGRTLFKLQIGNNHRIMLRGYRVDDSSVRISCQNSAGKEVTLSGQPKLVTGNTYRFIIEYDPATMKYHIYMDGKYMGGSSYKVDYGADLVYRVQVSDSGKWEFSNVTFFNPTHVHNTPVEDSVVEEVSITDKTLAYTSAYSCGEPIGSESLSKILAPTDRVYYGRGVVENIPTEGSFWIATDYNVRTSDALEAVRNSEADVVLGELKIAVDRATMSAPETYQIALKVDYREGSDRADVVLFVNGEREGFYENIKLSDSLELGSLDSTDLRFNYTKVVELGETAVDAKYNGEIDESLRPCRHDVYDRLIENVTREGEGKASYIEKCGLCGEIIYGIEATDHHNEKTSKLTYTNGKLTLTKDTRYFIPTALIGADQPYQISFKFTLDEIASAEGLLNNGNGRNIFQYRGSVNSILRLYPVSDGEGGYLEDEVDIGSLVSINNKSEKFMRLKEGETVNFSIIVDPADKSADIYVNGEFIMRREGKTDAVRPDTDQFAIGNPGYTATLSDIYILQSFDPHTHTDKYLSPDEKAESVATVSQGNRVEYTYVCYCGEKVTEGIESVLCDEIYPAYGLAESKVALSAPEFEGRAVFVCQMMVKSLHREGLGAVISAGDEPLVSIDREKKLYVGGASADRIAEEGYAKLVLVFSDGGYSAYYEGEYLGCGELSEVEDITLGNEVGSVLHFDSMAFATLSAGSNESYSVVIDSHVHSYDPSEEELIFNAEKTTVNVEYICPICDKAVVDGITKDLYDDPETDEIEAISAVIGSGDGAVIIESLGEYTADSKTYWISADFKLKALSGKNRQPVISLGESGILLIDADGTLRLADSVHSVVGSVKKEGGFNLTFSVSDGQICVYLDGVYCGELELDLSGADSVTIGAEGGASFEATGIKLCEIGNGGVRAIGAYFCQTHVYDASCARINYLETDSFSVKNRCLVCGYTVTERPVYNNYVGATTPVYDSHGGIELPLNGEEFSQSLSETYHGFWIVADVNVRSRWLDIGDFGGYKNLVGHNGRSLVLVDRGGALLLGNLKRTEGDRELDGPSTVNLAIEYLYAETDGNSETDDGYFNIYLDGEYAGGFAASEIEYTYEPSVNSREEFGAEGLENIKFYNIRSFVTAAEGETVGFEYAEDESVIPCAHVYDEYSVTKNAFFGEKIQVIYTCLSCGERVHTVYDEDLYDSALNSKFVFDENGELTINGTTDLVSSPQIIGSKGERYWLKFNLHVNSLNVEAVSENDNSGGKGCILLNFNINNNSPLRLFGVYDLKTNEYLDGCLSVRENANSNAREIVRIYEGGDYEFALFVDPAEKTVEIYLDGEHVTTRYNATYANGTNIRFLDGNWGSFTLSDFSFVSGDSLEHIHTAKYSEALGVTPSLEYTDETLRHVYACYCGEDIAEGIDEIYADGIVDIEAVTTPTAIPEATNAKLSGRAYWVSAKVYGDGSSAKVYSFGETVLVGIEGGKYTVGGKATELSVSHTLTPGDYDLISIKVIPDECEAVVYINGFVAGRVSHDSLADTKDFNVLLGGGAELDFRFIKVVSLANNASGRVSVADCGDHEFGYDGGIIALATDTGVDYICKHCNGVLRSVTLGDGGVIEKKEVVVGNGESVDLAEGEELYANILEPAGDQSIWMTFKVEPTDLSDFTDSDIGATLLKLQVGKNTHRIMLRAYRVDGETVMLTCQDSAGKAVELWGSPQLITGNSYSFVIEYNIETKQYHIYIDGRYVGGSGFQLVYGAEDQYMLYFGGSGDWELSDFRIFEPAGVEDKEITTLPETVSYPHTHFPDTSMKQSISVNDGIISQSFTCVCGKDIALDVMKDVVKGQGRDFSNIYSDEKYNVYNGVNGGTGTYVLSYDLTVHSADIGEISKNGDKGTAFMFLYDPDSSQSTALLYAYPHGYADNGTYTDRDGDGYADGVIELRSGSGKKSAPLLARLGKDESVNITYVIDPNEGRMAIYVDGEFVEQRENCAIFADATDAYVRIKAKGYGRFSYDNFRLVRMTDECRHEAPACAVGVYKVSCELCGKTVAPSHSYKAEYDRTNRWVKYTCQDCGAFHIEINDMPQLGNISFVGEDLLIKYLSDNYCPVFREAE